MLKNLYVLLPTKNEADRYLSIVIQRCLSFTSNVFVFDDQSTDNTVELARNLGATVVVRPDDCPSFIEHEGAFRQGSWSLFQDTMHPTPAKDWVFSIDADEILFGIEYLPELLDQTQYDVFGVMFYHLFTRTHYRVDKAWKPSIGSRLYRYYGGGSYKQTKMASGAEPQYVNELIRRGLVQWNTPLKMAHLSYIEDSAKIMKYERYKNLDGGNWHSLQHIESIIDAEIKLEPWEHQIIW